MTTSATRTYGRMPQQLRPAVIEPGFVRTATGSALISMGETRVICTASAQAGVPRWLVGAGRCGVAFMLVTISTRITSRIQSCGASSAWMGPMDDVPPRRYDRSPSGLRPCRIEPGFVPTATGSALITVGETRVICTASAQEGVPRWMAGAGRGWVTAEYAMLPASTHERKARDSARGRPDGRSIEIQRLIGRSLRGVVDFTALGEWTITIDCDVLTADGGTRCASITGGMVALQLACLRLVGEGKLDAVPLTGTVAAVSAGIVAGVALLDLDYSEDSTAEVDANVVMTGDGGLVEVQATAEGTPLSRAHLDELLALAAGGIDTLQQLQAATVAAVGG